LATSSNALTDDILSGIASLEARVRHLETLEYVAGCSNADTVDGYHAANGASQLVALDANKQLLLNGATAAIGISANPAGGVMGVYLDATGYMILNEDGGDVDSRIEGDADANLFCTDASTDRVGIGTNAPAQKLDVAGNIQFGAGGAGVDYTLTVNGETNDGVITWMEDEDYFQFGDDINLGGATNYVKLSDTDGNLTWGGTYKKLLTMRPQLYAGRVSEVSKPTFVTLGAYGGYSMPIYSADDEELFFRETIPGRWDGATDFTVYLVVMLASAETAGEDFRYQVSWASHVTDSGQLSNAVTDVETQQELAAGRAAQYSIYRLAFTIDRTVPDPDLAPGDHFGARIRRIAATGGGVDEVDGEVILLDCYITYTVDKVYKAS